MKNNSRWIMLVCLLAFCICTSGCISIEQEIFLQPDGSGDLLLHLSLPDLPEEAKSSPLGGPGNPLEAMTKFKQEIVAKLPPTIKLLEAKQTQRHGTTGFYAVFRFQDVREVQALMGQILQESTKDMPGSDPAAKSKPPEWTLKFDKQNGVTHFTQLFFADMSDAKVETKVEAKAEVKTETTPPQPVSEEAQAEVAMPVTKVQKKSVPGARRSAKGARRKTTPVETPAPPEPVQKPEATATASADFKMEGLESLASLVFAAIKFRFVLHTPSPIKESNADIVINGKSAMWDCSLAAFAKEKKPIEMKVSF